MDPFTRHQVSEAMQYLKHARDMKQDFIDDLFGKLGEELDYFDFC